MILNILKYIFPILDWSFNYKKPDLKDDFISGIVLAVVLIPQGMAYALIAGIPPIYGLYTALVPPLVYVVFGTGKQVSPGPVAMDSLLVFTGVSAMAELGSEYYMSLVFLLTLVVGLMQLALGLFRLGFLVNFMSKPVTIGFTSAAALLIGLNQFKHVFGVPISNSNQVNIILENIYQAIPNIDISTFLVGLFSMAIIVILKKVNKRIPSALVVVIFGILAVQFLPKLTSSVAVVGSIPSGLPSFSLPSWDWNHIDRLLPAAITLSFLGFLELISIAKTQEAMQDEYKVDSNKEFIALGIGNIIGSMFLSTVYTSSFSRSAIKLENNAKTQLSTVFSSVFIAVVLLYLTKPFEILPKAVLASIIIVAVFGLIKFKEAIRLWKGSKRDFWMLVITFFATIFLGIVYGVVVGIFASLILLLARSTRPHYAVLGRVEGTQYFRNVLRFSDVEINPEVLIIRFDSELYFANISYFSEELESQVRAKGESLKLIILDLKSMNAMDSSSADMLMQKINYFQKQGIKMYFANVKGPVRDTMTRFGITKRLGPDHFFMSIWGALEYYETGDKGIKDELMGYINQSNKYKV